MIGFLRGKILSKKPTSVLLDVNGIGYIVNVSLSTFDKLPADGETAELFTYLSVREDAMNLYGFYTGEEKAVFELLIGISGIGPKLALGILSGIQSRELVEAIQAHDVPRIVSIPGIGKKTAERLIIELKDKIGSVTGVETNGVPAEAYAVKGDAIAALMSLGYNSKKAELAVSHILSKSPDLQLEEIIKRALAGLNK